MWHVIAISCFLHKYIRVLFSAFSKPGSGSFVRPAKLTLGYSFIEALRKVCNYVWFAVCYTAPTCPWVSVMQMLGTRLREEREEEEEKRCL